MIEILKEPHQNSKQEYDLITTENAWEVFPIPYSQYFKWDEWGIFGVTSDYIVAYVPGCLVEIGVGWSSIFVSRIARKYSRQTFHCDLQRGVMTNYKSVAGYFNEDATLYVGSSDDFFKEVEIPPVALALIDGGHEYEQVKRDFNNIFPLVSDNGFIFIHDTYPPEEDWTHPNYCGDGYKLRQELEKRDDLDCFTFVYARTIRAMGVGLTMVRKKPQNLPYYQR